MNKLSKNIIENNELENGGPTACNIGLLCDSYNVMNPVIAYPESADFDHGGIYLSCQVEDKNGNITNTCFWGD